MFAVCADDEHTADNEWCPGKTACADGGPEDVPSIVVSVVIEPLAVMLSLSSLTIEVSSLHKEASNTSV